MRRLQGAFLAFVLAALAAPAGAAELTRVATSGEKRNPFDLDVSVRWDRTQERAEITRERAAAEGLPSGTVVEGDDLRYVRTRNAIVPRIAVGLYHDLELHAELPYVLGDDRELRYGLDGGVPTGGVPPAYVSSIEANAVDAEGQPCAAAPCPIFRVPQTVYHGGRTGDLQVGLAWVVFNERKDATKPTWVVGMDVTFPTAERYDPGEGRVPEWNTSPNSVPADPAPFGEKIWKWDVYTVLSKRMGPIDPYFKAHATAMFKSSSTYSNCEHAADMALRAPKEAHRLAAQNCEAWGSDADAQLPWKAGITFGTEVTPYEDARAEQKVSLDLRAFADYTSSHRFYNELTDYSGRLHETEGYLEMGGLVGLYLRASRYVSLRGTASLATRTAHWLSGESLGRDGAWPALDPSGNGLTANPAEMNPNFDWRYDAPGRRFRISEVSVFELSFAGVVQF